MSKYIPNAFQVPNAVVDEHMANMSGTAFKCYCLIIRKTAGWHKEVDYIPIAQFLNFCGLKKKDTISAALSELEQIGLNDRKEIKGKVTGNKLNLFKTEIESNPENGGDTDKEGDPENGGDLTPKNGGGSNPENGGTSKPTTKPINTKINIIKEKYKKEKKSKTEKHRLPDDWVLSEKNHQYAKDHGFDDSFISLLAEGFADYWRSDDAKNPLKSDWDSAWRNHVRDRKMRGYGQKQTSYAPTNSTVDELMRCGL